MDPEEFLKLGEELVERRNPRCCRTAIGRAYYGVFNGTAGILRAAGLPVSEGASEHGKIWHDLLNSGVAILTTAGSQLGELHGMRIKADYKMENPTTEGYLTAKLWVSEARTHFDRIKQVFDDPMQRAAAVQAIRTYRAKIGR